MKRLPVPSFLLLLTLFSRSAPAGEPSRELCRIETVRFASLPEQAASEEVRARLHALEIPPPITPSRESFELCIPQQFKNDGSWGLLVWVSPNESPRIPEPWIETLARHRLLCIGAQNAGNKRNILERITLAVSANLEMRARWKLDPSRMYVSGFSGGGRVASMLGVAYADLFKGTVAMMGVNFYTDLPSADGRKIFPPQYIPDDEVLEIAKRSCSFVLLTSEKDFNRADTRIVHELGFLKQGFPHLRYAEVPSIGHSMPEARWLDIALSFLDQNAR